jgi:aldehyde:ferredoxin oxidoreductase
MPLIFAGGPFVGTATPASSRLAVVSRSPLTNTIFDSSAGGRFALALKQAGYDYLEILGRADQLVLLEIDGTNVTIRPAEDLKDARVSYAMGRYDSSWSTAVIGPAGERQVRFASILIDGSHAAGRGGLGAVMGAKNLKLIAVRGTQSITVADPEALAAACEAIMRLLRTSQAIFGEFGFSEFGTAALVDVIHARRMEPTENFRKTFFPDSTSYSGYAIKKRYHPQKTGCPDCPILCKKIGYDGSQIPEYDTLGHFGALNANSDLEVIIKANALCNDFGLDTISAASTIACYAELHGTTMLPQEMLSLLYEIAQRQTTRGDELAEGSLRYASMKGRPDISMSVKGLELPAYDPRGAYGTALAYATSSRGGCHLRAYPISHEILRRPVATDRFSFEGKARMIKLAEDMNAVVDSLTACRFITLAVGLEELAKALSAITGRFYDVQSLFCIGERICNMEHALNVKNGFTVDDDDLPQRFFCEEGSSDSQIRIAPIDRNEFLAARANYYHIRGYAVQYPAQQKIRR